MATGPYRGCRDHDYRAVVIGVEISRKNDRYRRHSKFQQDWSKDRELVNGFNRSVEKLAEHEPGELSSEDEGIPNHRNGFLVNGKRKFSSIVFEKQHLIDERQNCQNGRLINGQRKISPIVWERSTDGKKQSVEAKNLIDVEGCGEELAPSRNTSFSLCASENAVLGEEDALSERRETSPPLDDQQNLMKEEEEFAPTRNILSSRWANGNDDEEAEAVVEEAVPKRRKTSPLDATPEPSARGGSDRSASTHSSSSEDRGDSNIDDCDDNGNGSEGFSGTESDEVDCEDKNPERSINMLQGCRSVDEFEKLNRIDEGTYGVVFRARDKKTGEVVALKKVKLEKEREGFPLTSLREINILLSLHHPSIVDVKEVVMGNMDSIYMVMEYMEHDLKGLMESMTQPFSQSEVKCLMLQLLSGVNYLHDNWVLHRDLKTSNILLNNRGELKICDFGLARQYGSPLKPYTQLVVTLWYRAPEILLGAKEYSTAIDMWSLGCIMAELLANKPLFPGKTEVDQLDKIFRILGTPNEKIWPGLAKLPRFKVNFVKQPYNKLREKFPPASFMGSCPTVSEAGFDLLNKLLTYDPEKRITAEDALNHAWFREVPLPKSKDFMPTFPAQHAQDRRLRRVMKSPDPLEELRRKDLQAGVGTNRLFG